MMVEVFKTNVKDPGHAKMLIDQIHATFSAYTANFDLEDCDKILRVKCAEGIIYVSELVRLLTNSGFEAQVLPDDRPEVLQRIVE